MSTSSLHRESTNSLIEVLSFVAVVCVSGVLCGECMDGFAVGMLSMECRHVTAHVNMYPWIIPMLGECGIYNL